MGVKVGGKKWVQLSLREYPHFFDSPEILGDAIVGLILFGDFTFVFVELVINPNLKAMIALILHGNKRR